MTASNTVPQTPISGQPDNPNSDANIVKMLDQYLAGEDLKVVETTTGYLVVDMSEQPRAVDLLPTRSEAYQIALDAILDGVVWAIYNDNEGGQE